MVFAPAKAGEIGIAPRHAPLLTTLKPGSVRVQTGEDGKAVLRDGRHPRGAAALGHRARRQRAARGPARRSRGARGARARERDARRQARRHRSRRARKPSSSRPRRATAPRSSSRANATRSCPRLSARTPPARACRSSRASRMFFAPCLMEDLPWSGALSPRSHCSWVCVASPGQTRADCEREYTPQRAQEGKDVVWAPTEDCMVGANARDGEGDVGRQGLRSWRGRRQDSDRGGQVVRRDGRRYRVRRGSREALALPRRSRRRRRRASRSFEGDIFETDFSDATVVALYAKAGSSIVKADKPQSQGEVESSQQRKKRG